MRVLLATTVTPDDRKTVACARSLASGGAWVAVGGEAFWGQAFYSRFVSLRVRYPHPNLGLPSFIAAINQGARTDRYDVVLPMNDYTTIALTRHREDLHPGLATALPTTEALEVAGDKLRTMEVAGRLGIETPATWAVSSEEQLSEVADCTEYPCVMKLRRGAGAKGFRVLASRKELLSAYRVGCDPSDLVFDSDQVLVQEFVPGETHDVCLLFRHGEPRAALTQRRVWTYPLEGGFGTLVESTREPDLVDRATRLLAALEWHGPAQVEFKVDPESGSICLMEINGRFWGSIDVAVRAGIDFPMLTCRLALDGDIEPVFDYATGLRYRFPFPFGLLAMANRAVRWQAARGFFGPGRGTHSDLNWSDPIPVLAEVAYIGRRAWERRSPRPGRSRDQDSGVSAAP